MRRWRWIVLAALCAPSQAAPRDPFQALPDPCAAPFHDWKVHAVVQAGAGNTVAIIGGAGGWRRLHQNDIPWPGWRVAEITGRRVHLQSLAHCPPVVLEGAPQGGRNGGKEPDSPRITVERHGAGGHPR